MGEVHPSVRDGLHDERLHQLPIVSTRGTWGIGQKHGDHFFFRVYPEHARGLSGKFPGCRLSRVTPSGEATRCVGSARSFVPTSGGFSVIPHEDDLRPDPRH